MLPAPPPTNVTEPCWSGVLTKVLLTEPPMMVGLFAFVVNTMFSGALNDERSTIVALAGITIVTGGAVAGAAGIG